MAAPIEFLNIEVINREATQSYDSIAFTHEEVRQLTKVKSSAVQEFRTVEGYSRTYPRAIQQEIRFEALLENPATEAKINSLLAYHFAGRVFSVTILAGQLAYSNTVDALIPNPSDSVINYAELAAFQNDWQVTSAYGLQRFTPCAIVFRSGKKPSVPTAADFLAYPPPIGGFGN